MARYEDLTLEEWHQLAARLAEERLPIVNEIVEQVIPADSIYVRYGKRIADIVVSVAALTVTLPLNLVFAMCTFLDVGRPILFRQDRLGMCGKTFTLVKFRNMTNATDERGNLLTASQRITRFGKFMRRTSLDELLNFWSILKGDMSVIGPRPLPTAYASRLNKRHASRMSVRPGLECPPHRSMDHYWTWQEQFENDVWYVEHLSLKTDIECFINLLRFAFDRESSVARSEGDERGSFIGYDYEGNAITEKDISDRTIELISSSS